MPSPSHTFKGAVLPTKTRQQAFKPTSSPPLPQRSRLHANLHDTGAASLMRLVDIWSIIAGLYQEAMRERHRGYPNRPNH